MLDFTEIPRVKVHGDMDEIRKIVRAGLPVTFEESDNEAFQRAASVLTAERIRSVFGDRPWTVQRNVRGAFDINEPFAMQTVEMPFSAFMDEIEEPDESLQYYLRLSLSPELDYAKDLFDDVRTLGAGLPLTRHANQTLNTLWLGAARNVTPLHYDDCARSHGVISGEKLFVLFPPDFRHYRNLEMFPIRSPAGWYSRVGAGPLDPELFPKLKKTRPYRALLGPGDFLFIPSCWWHHVSVPDQMTITVSARFTPRVTYLYWYYWRLRLTRLLKGQQKLFYKVKAEREAAGAAAAS